MGGEPCWRHRTLVSTSGVRLGAGRALTEVTEQLLGGSERVVAKFAHLREQQCQIEAEERARAEVADLDE